MALGSPELAELALLTPRLRAGPWHRLAADEGVDLVEVVGEVLTEDTTAALPPSWQGAYPPDRAARWIAERDAESPTLLVVERSTGRAIGLLILWSAPADDGSGATSDIRIGYVLAMSASGRGLATELVGGLVAWALAQPDVVTITAGVEADHPASRSVLARNGFAPIDGAPAGLQAVITYRRDVTDSSPWDEAAPGWDADPAARTYAAAAFGSLLDVLEGGGRSLDGARVLDFGCGTGLLIDHLADRVAVVDAVDSSPAMRPVLAAKVDRNGWGEVRVWSAPPPGEGGYDLVVCSSVLGFVDDLSATVGDLAERLAPGGLLVSWDWERTDADAADAGPDEADADPHGLTRAEVRGALEAAGLVDIEVGVGFEVEFDGHTMCPLRGIGVRPADRA